MAMKWRMPSMATAGVGNYDHRIKREELGNHLEREEDDNYMEGDELGNHMKRDELGKHRSGQL